MKRWIRKQPVQGPAQPPNEQETGAGQTLEHNLSRRHFTRPLLLGAPVTAAALVVAVPPVAAAGDSRANAAAAPADAWKLGGNAVGKSDGSLFLGTTDKSPVVVKTQNTERMRIRDDGLVGIGTSPGGAQLAVGSSIGSAIRGETTAAAGAPSGVLGLASKVSSDSAGVRGAHLAGGSGVIGTSDTSIGGNTANGIGVNGLAMGSGTGVRGQGFVGVRGISNSPSTTNSYAGLFSGNVKIDGGLSVGGATSATGVSGVSSSPTGRGVFGLNQATSGEAVGVFGTSNAPNGRGVVGLVVAPGGSSIAVHGQAASAGSTAVFADATSKTGFTNGVYARVASPDGAALRAEATATTGSADGAVITTTARFGTGVYVASPSIALFAEQTRVDGIAAYFKGDIYVEGTGSIGSSVRKIDHPLDPENKYLAHAYVASPEMLSVYSGTTTTDARGLATVKLPAYVEALNRDFRYQLTVLGQFAQAIVARKVAGGQFTIQTDKPGVEVSWQLTGIQQDPFAEAHRVVAELDKPKDERGLLLHPREHGFGEERGLSRSRSRQEPTDK